MSMDVAKKPKPPVIRINQQEADATRGAFMQTPHFWVDDFYGTEQHIINKKTGERIKEGMRVPASFWKYTYHLWRHVTVPRWNGTRWMFHTKIAMDQFPVRGEAAVQWSAAYAVSGVMTVMQGRWTAKHDQPTEFMYNPNAPHAAWRCFFRALDSAINQMACDGNKAKGNTKAWQVLVAVLVDKERAAAGLDLCNQDEIHELLKVTNHNGEPVAKVENGKVMPIFYERRSRSEYEEEYATWGAQ